MPDLVCDTSAIQYLHQTGLIRLLRELAENVLIPPAVKEELNAGRKSGIDLPDIGRISWIKLVHPRGEKDTRLVGDMGPGEAEVMMLALETDGRVAVLDDALARKRTSLLGIPFTGTLGLLRMQKLKG